MSDEYRLEVDGIIVANPETEDELLELFRKHKNENKVKMLMDAKSRREDGLFKTICRFVIRPTNDPIHEPINELVEVWRKQFCDHYRTKRCTAFHDGRFLDDRTEILYHGWLAAKRSQPVIELPKILYEWDIERDSDQKVQYLDYENTIHSITAAGYQYKVKE